MKDLTPACDPSVLLTPACWWPQRVGAKAAGKATSKIATALKPKVPKLKVEADAVKAEAKAVQAETQVAKTEASAEIKSGSTYKQRIDQTPTSNGTWSGTRGESEFKFTNPDVASELKGTGVVYKNGYPDFTPYAAGEVNIAKMSTHRGRNFEAADIEFGKQAGMTRAEVAEWRLKHNYTWHEHENLKTMQLVPTQLNAKFGHVGGIGEINAGKVK